MILGADGRLEVLEAVAKEVPSGAIDPQLSTRDPAALFVAAGLDYSRFKPAAPLRIPTVPFDTRLAWAGTYADDRPEQVMVQAAWWQGKPVYFNGNEKQALSFPSAWLQLGLFILILVGSVSVARRNWRLGRGDRAGATRLAIFTFALVMLSWVFTAHHVVAPWEVLLIVKEISWAGFVAGVLWCLYMAIEPYARRHWPDSLISWTRVQQGRLRNPLVASHALAGLAVVAGGLVLNSGVRYIFSTSRTQPPVAFLDSAGQAAGYLLSIAWANTFITLGMLLLLMLARFVFRRVWIADTVVALLVGWVNAGQVRNNPYLTILFIACSAAIWLSSFWLFRRFGLLCIMMTLLVPLAGLPPPDWSTWYFSRALIGPLIPVAIAAWAVWVIVSASRPAPETAG